jgi:hypothetical protein
VVVRNRETIESMLAKGTTVVLPVFDPGLATVAEQVKVTLATRGVTVEIRQNPAIGTYTIATTSPMRRSRRTPRLIAETRSARSSETPSMATTGPAA